jgi:hypothetical protein
MQEVAAPSSVRIVGCTRCKIHDKYLKDHPTGIRFWGGSLTKRSSLYLQCILIAIYAAQGFNVSQNVLKVAECNLKRPSI